MTFLFLCYDSWVPRRNTAVKNKHQSRRLSSIGAVDLHFHGAFGIDLMRASTNDMNELSRALWERGVAALCPTTLSTGKKELAESVVRIGRWIRSERAPGAIPLGIHLEGPFISPHACGAHPPAAIRPLDFEELDRLWEKSLGSLKILTIAPEILLPGQLPRLIGWSRKRRISLSAGHSKATERQAHQAFAGGFRGVTHAWNALAFHHRSPGVMGAALGREGVYLEIIIDRIHVSSPIIRWTCRLHPEDAICFVSDCAPAAGLKKAEKRWVGFGPLRIRYQDGACRLKDGQLAGGGQLLTEAFASWVELEAQTDPDLKGRSDRLLLTTWKYLNQITLAPLKSIGQEPKRLKNRRVDWEVRSGRLVCRPSYRSMD